MLKSFNFIIKPILQSLFINLRIVIMEAFWMHFAVKDLDSKAYSSCFKEDLVTSQKCLVVINLVVRVTISFTIILVTNSNYFGCQTVLLIFKRSFLVLKAFIKDLNCTVLQTGELKMNQHFGFSQIIGLKPGKKKTRYDRLKKTAQLNFGVEYSSIK